LTKFFESLGFRPGRLFASMAATSELFSGLLIALGLLGPAGPALILAVMIVAAGSVHWNHGLFAANNGIEVPLLYGVVAAGLTFTGAGRLSVDELLRISAFWTPALSFAAFGAGLLGGAAGLVLRRPSQVPASV